LTPSPKYTTMSLSLGAVVAVDGSERGGDEVIQIHWPAV
jgi:hypothetical protein